MPLDNSLNADITRLLEYHCRATLKLEKSGPRIFCMSTPNLISAGVCRLFECRDYEEGVPNYVRTIPNCDIVWDSMNAVYLKERGSCA